MKTMTELAKRINNKGGDIDCIRYNSLYNVTIGSSNINSFYMIDLRNKHISVCDRFFNNELQRYDIGNSETHYVTAHGKKALLAILNKI